MSTVVEKKKVHVVPPFSVEIDTPRNGDVMIQSIPGCRLRGGIDSSKPVIVSISGEKGIPVDQARTMGLLPKIPGMRISVNPSKLSYKITDPLFDDEDLCEKIRKGLEAIGSVSGGGKIRGATPLSGKLDEHRMKTLCRELVWLLSSNCAKMVNGPEPDLDDISELPGKFLLNPGSQVHNSQPQFEEDFSKWVDRLSRSGG